MNPMYATGEDAEQMAVISWAGWMINIYPELELLHHCPNGGSRHKAEAVKLKQIGVKPGMPDLCLPVPKGKYAGLYIEMKCGSNKLQETQKEKLAALARYGHYCTVCYSSREAIEVLEEYLGLNEPYHDVRGTRRGDTMQLPNLSIRKNGEAAPMPEPENRKGGQNYGY